MLSLERLPAFFSDLRAHGFSLGPLEYQRTHELLIELHAARSIPTSGVRLGNMLGSVLCTNEEQQRHFRQRFDAFFGCEGELGGAAEVSVGTAAAISAPSPLVAGTRAAVRRETSRFRRRLVISGIAAALVLFSLDHEHVRIVQTLIKPQGYAIGQGVGTARRGLPVSGQASNLNLQTHGRPSWVALATLFVVFLPFPMLALWAAKPGQRRNVYLQRRQAKRKPTLLELLLSPPKYNGFDSSSVLRHLQRLRQPKMLDSLDIDVDATINATIENASLFTPRYARRPVAPEYLVLIERNGKDDHLSNFAESLVSVLKSSQVYIDVYYFQGDFRRAYLTNSRPRISLEELVGRHRGHRLILITNGTGLINPVSGRIEDWALQVLAFGRRICFTPTPKELWGARERAIAVGLDLPILPLLPTSVPMAVDYLTREVRYGTCHLLQTLDETEGALGRLADMLESRPSRWSSSVPPTEAVLGDFEETAQKALGSAAYRWLAACAVYPELKWNLTVHIGEALRDALGRATISSERLLLLSMLPWFREGSMPKWLRVALIDSLPVGEYERLHALLGRLLMTVFSAPLRAAHLNVSVDRKLRNQDTSDEHADSPEDDIILADFMARSFVRDKTRFALPEAIVRYLHGKLQLVSRRGAFRSGLDWLRESAVILHTTLGASGVSEITVLRGALWEFSEQPGFRPVISFTDPHRNPALMGEGYCLFLPTGARLARLLDQATAVEYVRREQLVIRIGMINFAFIVIAAFFFAKTILAPFNDSQAVSVVCLWLLIPYAIADLLLLRRFKACLRFFPAFVPDGKIIFKATRFFYRSL